MMKLFRVHHVHANGLETLALTVSAGGLKSAVKRVREHPLIRLPNGTYYIFEAIEEDGEEQLAEVEDEELLDKLAEIFESHFDELYESADEE